MPDTMQDPAEVAETMLAKCSRLARENKALRDQIKQLRSTVEAADEALSEVEANSEPDFNAIHNTRRAIAHTLTVTSHE